MLEIFIWVPSLCLISVIYFTRHLHHMQFVTYDGLIRILLADETIDLFRQFKLDFGVYVRLL